MALEYLVSSPSDMKRGRDLIDFLVAKGAVVSSKIRWTPPNWILEVNYERLPTTEKSHDHTTTARD